MKTVNVAGITPAVLVALALLTVPGAGADPPAGLESVSLHKQGLQNQLLVDLQSIYTKQEMDDGVYVGSEFCLACHPEKAGWRTTKHARALRRPLTQHSLVPGRGVVADHDNNGVDDFVQGLDFNAISSPFNPYKPNAPKLSVEGGVYYMTIGQLKMRVVATDGGTGDWKQRYLLEVPVASGGVGGVSAENYVSPVQYNEVRRRYVAYHPEHWYNGSNQPRFNAATTAAGLAAGNDGSYSKNCIGCHATGVRGVAQTAAGEWRFDSFIAVLFDPADPGYFDYNRDGITDLVNIGCESCHGPGAAHIIGGGDPRRIVNPDDLATTQANEVCGQCHLRVESVPGGTHAWPFDDAAGRSWHPGRGEPLEDFFTDAGVRWPDDVNSRENYQQYFDFLASEKPAFPFHPVRCSECHAVHGNTSNPHLVRDVIVDDGLRIPTRDENGSLCLACHATHGPFEEITLQQVANFEANREEIGRVVSAHTNHPFAPERTMGLSYCSGCHMPKIATSAELYDIASHSFEAIPPEKNLTYQAQGGMPDSCSVTCHSLKANLFGLGITDDIGTWNRPFDRQSARRLQRFFGPGGRWWDTSDMGSATFRSLEAAAAPGEVPEIPDSELE
jgi:hypothetical protein